MGVFDFLFGSKLTIERLVKLDEGQLQEDLKKRNIRELQKFCLKGCENLNNEEKQKEVYVNAIMQFIREKRSELENSAVPENVKAAISESVESKPVDLQNPPAEGEMAPPPQEPEPVPEMEGAPMEEKPPQVEEESSMDSLPPPPPRGGKDGKKRKGGRTRRSKEKAEKAEKEKKGGKRRNSKKKKCMI